MSELKICPCGQLPKKLNVSADSNTPKWAYATGSCCNEWIIEFRNSYEKIGGNESIRLANDAWNNMTRGF